VLAALRSYTLLVRWNVVRMRSTLPVLLFLQTLIGVGIVVGFSFLVPQADAQTALYLSTGALTIGLITVGMVAAPQVVAAQKLTGALDHQRALPVPRLAMLAADATVWVGLAVPGLAAALGVAALRFDLSFTVSPLLPVAVLLVAVCSVAIGYGIAYAASPSLAGALSQLILFVALMFAPINYPADRLPDWLETAHEWLPFTYMAQAIRETVDVPTAGVSVTPFAVLALWGIVGLAITYRVMVRRT
jgi:ABC-2 type transport system permease protein